jgi:hypothetical protein
VRMQRPAHHRSFNLQSAICNLQSPICIPIERKGGEMSHGLRECE